MSVQYGNVAYTLFFTSPLQYWSQNYGFFFMGIRPTKSPGHGYMNVQPNWLIIHQVCVSISVPVSYINFSIR